MGRETSDGSEGLRAGPPMDAGELLDATQDCRDIEQHVTRLAQLVEQYLADLNAGRKPDRTRMMADHPELANALESCLAGIDFIHGAGSHSERPMSRLLGDFRILREIGRGGMGAVYEAEQLSLGRRVALKVLRFGSVSDPEALQRFRREAETVARLHHTNIVPIFAVGSAAGVNYYAMQFIDGPSLDMVLRERGGPVEPQEVADWGLQAAEALVHAHARDVIHRDVKPSNLLLDCEGRIWLTDFGLAKRLDDVTLSMSGMLLGTPRYMSPEQAAAQRTLDHRTDIYSLGATLYELATGEPVFTGTTPQDVISQILTAEPLPPRRHRPALPRDLETILMKCLAKEPVRRYASARDLAHDLRSFQEGRPIAARRASVVERCARWWKRQKRSVALSAVAIAATLLMVTLGAVGYYFWQRSRLAFVRLNTDRPPLVAEVLVGDQPVVPPMTVPNQHRVEVPAGDYQLRLSSEGRLSQSFNFHLARGEVLDRKINLEDQLLWRDVRLERTFRPFGVQQSAGTGSLRTDVLSMSNRGVGCISGHTGAERWQLQLIEPTHALLRDDVHLAWPWDRGVLGNFTYGLGLLDSRPYVVGADVAGGSDGCSSAACERGSEVATSPPLVLDLDADGHSDLLLAARHQAWIIAISGADGQPLWVAARGGAARSGDVARQSVDEPGAVVYPPVIIPDVDDDGVPDVLAVFVMADTHKGPVQRWVEVLSGGSGRSIWRYELPDEWFALPNGQAAPVHLSWFFGLDGGHGGGGTGGYWHQGFFSRGRTTVTRTGTHAYLPTSVRLLDALEAGQRCEPVAALIAGQHFLQLDLRNGEPTVSPQDMLVRPVLEPCYADLDGDGRTDVLIVEPLPDKTVTGPGAWKADKPRTRLSAWSPATGTLLWQRELEAVSPQQQTVHAEAPHWPQAVDLDGDGACEVLVPDGSTLGLPGWQSEPWGRLSVLDGRTGAPRWDRQIYNLDQQLEYFLAGPDVDGDGLCEVFVASFWGDDFRLFVDCLSGRDGSTLWRNEHRLLSQEGVQQGRLRMMNLQWYRDGGDTWPQLVAPFRTDAGELGDGVCLFSAGTSCLTHYAGGVSEVTVANLDADGVADLLLFQRADADTWTGGGTLQGVRGTGQEPWREIGQHRQAVGDLDGDGIRDLLVLRAPGELAAQSAATGRLLWRVPMSFQTAGAFAIQGAAECEPRQDLLPKIHDLDGDSVPDVLLVAGNEHTVRKRPVLVALSGRTGRRLWSSELSAELSEAVPMVDVRDLDGDGRAEIIVVAAINFGVAARQPFNQGVQLWLAVLDGGSGRTRWMEPLTEPGQPNRPKDYDFSRASLEAAYADHNDDRTLDIILPAQQHPGDPRLEMRAFSGADGRPLWRFLLPAAVDRQLAFANVPPAAVADVDGDGRSETILLSLSDAVDIDGVQKTFARIDVLEPGSGSARWHWQTPVGRHANEVRGDPRRVKTRIRPMPVRRRDGKHWIALLTRSHGNQDQLHVLEEDGNMVSQWRLEQPDLGMQGNRLWPIDADGNGGEQLVLLSGNRLSLLDPDRLDQPRWQHEDRLAFGQVVGLLPDASAPGQIVVMGAAGDHSLRGVDARSGRAVWLCVGPMPSATHMALDAPVLLSLPSPDLAPWALYQDRAVAIMRRGLALPGTTAAPTETGVDPWSAVASPLLAPTSPDPRLRRPLPWRPQDHEIPFMLREIGWFAFYGVTLAAVPIVFAGSLIRRRQWSMKTMLMMPVVASLAMMGFLWQGPGAPGHSLGERLAGAFLLAGPVMFSLLLIGRWLWQRRWKVVAAWLVAGILLMAGAMALSLFFEAGRRMPLQPDEYYSWSGWYWIAPPVLLLLAWLLVLGVSGSALVRLARSHWRRPFSAAWRAGFHRLLP
jgi:hypothetical protein